MIGRVRTDHVVRSDQEVVAEILDSLRIVAQRGRVRPELVLGKNRSRLHASSLAGAGGRPDPLAQAALVITSAPGGVAWIWGHASSFILLSAGAASCVSPSGQARSSARPR